MHVSSSISIVLCLSRSFSCGRSETSIFVDWKQSLLALRGSETESKQRRPTHCYSCTSIDASEIIGGAGVHPGVYLTSILLSTIPVTSRCHDPFITDASAGDGGSAVDRVVGLVASPMCEDGLCVKINYTDKQNGRSMTIG